MDYYENFNYFNDFIKSVYQEMGEDAGYSYEYIAYWFVGNHNLGRLNNLIGTSYSGSYVTGMYGEMKTYSISPEMGRDESAIYKKIFEFDFYTKQARNTLKGVAGSDGNDWVSLREGDSSITRINRNEIAKNFKGLADSAKDELNKMAQSYLKFNLIPQQVVGDDYMPAPYYNGASSDYGAYRLDRDYLL
jgi:hypothetical protein